MPNSFTPQQIEQFLQEFFDVVGARQYIGARYVPIFGRAGEDTVEWDDTEPYEPLTVVMHQGVSYVSRRYVPNGIQITDTDYWVETYRYNAQVEQYRQEVLQFQSQIDRIREDMESDYVPFPDSLVLPKYGTLGQVLTTLANGDTKWEDPVVPSDEQAEEVIAAWLNAHPEATTTVQNGSITDVKINTASHIPRLNSPTGLTDFNDAKNAGVYRVDVTSWANAPVARTGLLAVFNAASDVVAQIFFNSDGYHHYARLLWSSWGPWIKLFNDNQNTVTDLNNATENAMSYRYPSTAANAPETVEGNLFVFGNGNDNKVQIAATATSVYYFRRKWGSTWYPWFKIPFLGDIRSAMVSSVLISDLNTATVSGVAFRYDNNASNAPSTYPGNLLPFGNGSDNKVQVAVDSNGTIYYRRIWGSTWTSWNALSVGTNRYPFGNSPANLSTIPQIGIIGDSYASGEIVINDAYVDIYEQSWGQIIARTKGITVYNYSQGGASAASFVNGTGERDLQGLLNSTKRNLYLIVLGINDDKSAAAIGTSADIGTSANTFYGNYSRIIESIQTYSPHSKIVVVTPANNTDEGYQRLNAALETIAAHYSIPIVREYDDPFFTSSYYRSTMVSGHPTPSSYGGMANALTGMIENCMADNSTYFYDVNAYTL